ncbi:claudin-2-like [Scleropages formosus]|uniref:Claudin-2-like n=1 Tax=Scleropages formosus TaxID=113540 RepID=A0A0P7V8D0_SCLFO|nr:claudin-2-like [Scleropages formosus]
MGFCVGSVGWILSAVTTGLIQWRVWYVADTSVITSGVAWVGIWKVCFYSRLLVTSGNEWIFCQSMKTWELFVPPEICAAQVLMLAAVIAGVCGSSSAVYGLRNIYFGMEEQKPIRTAFNLAGALYLSSGVCSLVPLAWNIWSVACNHAIAFPPSFHMPSTPVKQEVGEGIGVGIISSALMLASGVVFLSYRFPVYPSQGMYIFKALHLIAP